MPHLVHGQLPAVVEVRSESCAQAHTIVASGGLHKNSVDDSRRQDFSVGLRIQCHPPGQANVSRAGFGDCRARERHHRFLAGVLHRECQIFVLRVDLGFGFARRPKAGGDAGKRGRLVVEQETSGNLVRIIVGDNEVTQIDTGLPVRSKAHHFPLIAVGLKTEVLSELRVEKTERIRPGNRPHVFEAAIAPMPEGRRFPRAASIEDEHGGIVKS